LVRAMVERFKSKGGDIPVEYKATRVE